MSLKERIDRIIRTGEIELAGGAYKGKLYQKSLVHIPQIIENMKFLKEMKPDKKNSKYGKYSYYITGVNIDGRSHAILSTIGHNENGIYYDHNVFEGTPKEVFVQAKNATTKKFDRLKEILQNIEGG